MVCILSEATYNCIMIVIYGDIMSKVKKIIEDVAEVVAAPITIATKVVEKGIKLGSTALGAGTGILFGGGISGKITDTLDKMSDAASDVAGAMGTLGKTKMSEVQNTVHDTVKKATADHPASIEDVKKNSPQ